MIHHSDRGSQYTSISFGQRLEQAGVLPSMGSLAESFIVTIKRELLEKILAYQRRGQECDLRVCRRFYNRQRIHSALGYSSPADYEEGRMGEGVAA